MPNTLRLCYVICMSPHMSHVTQYPSQGPPLNQHALCHTNKSCHTWSHVTHMIFVTRMSHVTHFTRMSHITQMSHDTQMTHVTHVTQYSSQGPSVDQETWGAGVDIHTVDTLS